MAAAIDLTGPSPHLYASRKSIKRYHNNKMHPPTHTLTFHKRTRPQGQGSERRIDTLLISEMLNLQFQNLATCSKSCTLFPLSVTKA